MKILVINSGSSSLKFQLWETDDDEVLASGLAERIGALPGESGSLRYKILRRALNKVEADMPDHDAAMDLVFRTIIGPDGAIEDIGEISAIGHRVVHGGERFSQPTVINDESLAEIEKMCDLAPLHNPPNLMGIRACMRLMPGVPQVAIFDTAFHATIPNYAYIYALPYEIYTQFGVRRYGFHGTSHKYVAGRAQKILAAAGCNESGTKIITCHLGNGCSATAVAGGKVIDTSMGLTPAEGLVMGTRSGDLDPAILLYLIRQYGWSPEDVDQLINKKSGLLGVSGTSNDMRDVISAMENGDAHAALAFQIFCYRVKKYIGAYAAAMGGLDAIVFTGGIGENNPCVREWICSGLEFLGVKIDPAANAAAKGECDISYGKQPVRILVIPTNEELMIARETAELISADLKVASYRS